MIKLSFDPDNLDFPNDCERICRVLKDNGYLLSLTDAERLWDIISHQEYSAGWMSLSVYNDRQLFEELNPYIFQMKQEEIQKGEPMDKYRYVFARDDKLHFVFYTLDEIQNGRAKDGIEFVKKAGYELISRDRFTDITDRNGKEIYQNDRMWFPGMPSAGEWIVTWDDKKGEWVKWYPRDEAEVIGTIYDMKGDSNG